MNPAAFQIQAQHCLQPTDLYVMQCSRSQLYLSQWGKYFHKTRSLWSSFQLKSVSLTRGQRELQDSCCWRRNVLNETWDWAAGIEEDHHWKTLTYEGPETLKRYFYFTFMDRCFYGLFYCIIISVSPMEKGFPTYEFLKLSYCSWNTNEYINSLFSLFVNENNLYCWISHTYSDSIGIRPKFANGKELTHSN